MCRRDDWVQTVRDLVPSTGKQDSTCGTTPDILLKVRVRSPGGWRSSVRMHIPANVLHSELYLGTRHVLHVRLPIYSLPAAAATHQLSQHNPIGRLTSLHRELQLAMACLQKLRCYSPLRTRLLAILLPG